MTKVECSIEQAECITIYKHYSSFVLTNKEEMSGKLNDYYKKLAGELESQKVNIIINQYKIRMFKKNYKNLLPNKVNNMQKCLRT